MIACGGSTQLYNNCVICNDTYFVSFLVSRALDDDREIQIVCPGWSRKTLNTNNVRGATKAQNTNNVDRKS